MATYIQIVDGNKRDKHWWNQLVRCCAVIGEPFEIHCWSDERSEMELALRFGEKVRSSWHGGTVIRGKITREFLKFLTEAPKPGDTDIYNKMTPFFSLFLGDVLYSEHYGTEVTITRCVTDNWQEIDRVLRSLERCATIHRNMV